MKILFVCSHEWVYSENANPFVSLLIEGLVNCGHQVKCGLDDFWSGYANYDILFFQWPESIYDWNCNLINIKTLSNPIMMYIIIQNQ